MRRVEEKLDDLITDRDRRDGAIGLGKWLVGGGFFSAVGGILIAVWHFIHRAH